MLGSLILYLKGMRIVMFQLSGFYYTLNYGNYGIFLIMGSAGFCPSTVQQPKPQIPQPCRTR